MGIEIRAGAPDDVTALFEIINDAYEVETGDSGVAFKHTKRLLTHDELTPQLDESFVCLIDGKHAGAIVFNLTEASGAKRCHFGPFAVAPGAQGQGVGRALLQHLEEHALKCGAVSLDIEVVHHRADILPMYAKMGYEEYGTGPFPAPERVTRPCHFILLRRSISTHKSTSKKDEESEGGRAEHE